ncbi:MAG: T9SS C-terminal target domain-containing protein, partial [Bacteroidetes bacterium]
LSPTRGLPPSGTLSAYDAAGRLQNRWQDHPLNAPFDIRDLPPGFYLFHLALPDGSQRTWKISKN